MNFVLAAGGTGGHMVPAHALAAELRKRGHGVLLTAILRAVPRLQAVLLDRAPVVERARGRLEAAGLAGRCEFIAGDFFTAVPADGDAHVLSRVIHD